MAKRTDMERTARNHATVPRAVADRLADKVATAIHRATNDAGYTADRLIRAEAEINGALAEYRKAVAGG
jgi:hypothetical protein